MTAVRSITEPDTGLRNTKTDEVAPSPSAVGGSTPNAAIDARDARSADSRLTGCGFRLLNLSWRRDLLSRQATFARECRLGELESGTGRQVFGALARQLGACQLRKRLAGSHGVTRIDVQSGDRATTGRQRPSLITARLKQTMVHLP